MYDCCPAHVSYTITFELLYATKFNYHYCCKDELLQLSHKCTHYTYAFMLSYLAMFTDSEAILILAQ